MSQEQGEAWWQKFQELLDDQNVWPAEYLFKFIVPTDKLDEVRHVFGQVKLEERPSRRGKYTSVTARMLMHSSDEVIAIYTAVGRIEGVMSL